MRYAYPSLAMYYQSRLLSNSAREKDKATYPLWGIPMVISKHLWKSMCWSTTLVGGLYQRFSSDRSHSFIFFSSCSNLERGVRQSTCRVKPSNCLYGQDLVSSSNDVANIQHTPLRLTFVLLPNQISAYIQTASNPTYINLVNKLLLK